ncbi:MAG: ArsR family transcriptional regulator [Phycisphaerales bacterium]|nr:ArsR family transcriptional regulator [Phycisphaerales bacterium]
MGNHGQCTGARVPENYLQRLQKFSLTTGRDLYNLLVMELVGYGNLTPDRLDATFAALADRTRRAILARLAGGEASVAELAKPFAMSQPAISKHLKVLERAGLVSRGVDAQRRPRKLEARPLAEVTAWLERYRDAWEQSYERLDALLEEMKSVEQKRPKK